MKFYSQWKEDEFLVYNRILDLNKSGFFVDVGAGDPIKNSNTYVFEEHGWAGICIDADPNQVAKLKEKRTNVIQTAIANHDGKIKIDFHPLGDISRVSKNGKTEIGCKKLSTVFKQLGIKRVDLLSIDVEGQELEVLNSMPSMKFEDLPEVIIVEYISFIDGNKSAELHSFFEKLPYKEIHRTHSNLIFKKVKIYNNINKN